ncbi:MAG: hypothetical protein ACREIC_13595, partial [Limisphaerales bacterium]
VQFLYERIYQRPAQAEEVQLGLDFIGATSDQVSSIGAEPGPDFQQVSTERQRAQVGPAGRRGFGNRPGMRRREPLKPWQEYAHALLQANETSFIN